MEHTLRERVRHAIVDIPGLAVAVIFGSRARGEERSTSDLDLAVLPEAKAVTDADSLERHRLQKRLAVALSALAPESRVDVVFLDEAPDTIRQRVMEHGQMVLCRDPRAWQELRVKTMKEYGDRAWARTLYRRELRRRLTERSPSDRSARHREPLERARGLSGEARQF